MSEYIKLEDIEYGDILYNFATDEKMLVVTKEDIESLPTIEIVRCKDCMLNTINTDGATEPWCYKFGYAVEDTDFCSFGERRAER